MRWIILGLIAAWTALTAFAYVAVLPERAPEIGIVRAYLDLEGQAIDHVDEVIDATREELTAQGVDAPPRLAELLATDDDQSTRSLLRAFRAAWQSLERRPLDEIPTLVWSTDDNPAREVQMALFRAWHLRNYAEPVDIVADPSNRDATKTVVQCVAGSGPDLIESYGPAELTQFIDAGVALDVTERAKRDGFAIDRVFDTAVASIAREEDGQLRQYAFPCNLGYTVLFYHRDLFADAGVPEPSGPWSVDEMIPVANALLQAGVEGGRRRVGIMNLGPWDMALAAGARFFNDDATACIYNGPEAIAAFSDYQDLMYRHRVMPTPAEAASMAASGGAAMNMGAEAASASSLFAAKVTAMYVGGRWEYVSLASRNRDRVIRPAIQRRLLQLADDDAPNAALERELLLGALDTLGVDAHELLTPMPDAQRDAVDAILTPEDRARLIQLGVTHVPTVTGQPFYTANARVAIVNRASPRAEFAVRFLRFLASEPYNEQINQTFDSICGVPEYCLDDDGIGGPPEPLPGLSAFDSPVFVDAAFRYAVPDETSPFIGRARLGTLVGQVLEMLTNNEIGPAEAARLIESRIDRQMRANIQRDPRLRAQWEQRTGVRFDPDTPLRDQITQDDAP